MSLPTPKFYGETLSWVQTSSPKFQIDTILLTPPKVDVTEALWVLPILEFLTSFLKNSIFHILINKFIFVEPVGLSRSVKLQRPTVPSQSYRTNAAYFQRIISAIKLVYHDRHRLAHIDQSSRSVASLAAKT